MAYELAVNLVLASTDTGLSLSAQLIDTAGANVGSAVTTGFVEVGLGNYLWSYASFPDGFRGGVKFSISGGGALKAFVAINPQDGENVDVRISTRASQTSVDTIDDFLDTEIAAIKAKTDNLPSDPADASDIAGAFTTVNSTLATIASYIDTEVSAIKAKTDQLTFTVPNRVDAQVLGMATDTITADALASSAVTEIQAGMLGGNQVIEVVQVQQSIEVAKTEQTIELLIEEA